MKIILWWNRSWIADHSYASAQNGRRPNGRARRRRPNGGAQTSCSAWFILVTDLQPK